MEAGAKSKIAQRRNLARKSGDADYQQKRDQILKCAAGVFRDKGFDGATMNDFAKALNMDRASIYYYVGSKDELFQELVRDAVRDNVSMAEGVLAGSGRADDKIRDIICRLMLSFEYHYPYLYVFVQEDMARIAKNRSAWAIEIRDLAGRFTAALRDIIAAGIHDGTFRVGHNSPQITAYAIIGMCNWSHRWFKPNVGLNGKQVGDELADLVLKGLQSPH